MRWKLTFLMALLAVTVGTAAVQASQCVSCHTDAEQLKTITKTLPSPVASAETAGKG